MKFQTIIGSVREGRVGGPVGKWIEEVASTRDDFEHELIDLKEWNLPMFNLPKGPIMGDYEDAVQKRWAAKITEADGYLFVSPEYNHGYSPALKNALDYLYAEWNRKPASYATYGSVQGARSIEQLRLVLIELQIAPLREALHINDVWSKVSDGKFSPADNEAKQLHTVFDDLLWWGKALKKARESKTP